MLIMNLHVNGLEPKQRYINSVTTGHAKFNGHLSTQFVKKYIKSLYL